MAIFFIKIISGFAFGWFYQLPQYYSTADTWRFYHLSLKETDWLLKDPTAFIKDLFSYGYNKPGNIFSGSNSYWNDLKSNVFVKLMAIINVLSHNNYYVNIILFNFLFMFGLMGIYRVLSTVYINKKWLLILGVFLIPSSLFWCSGIHKDGLILSATGLIIYHFYQSLNKNHFSLKSVLIIIICLALIFTLRNYVTLALLPGLFCLWISYKNPEKKKWIFPIIYIAGIMLFFTLSHLIPSLDFPGFIINKQQEFISLSGGSSIKIEPLQPGFINFFKYLPTALDMAFFRPHLSEAKSPAALLAFFEIVLVFSTLVLFFLFPEKNIQTPAVTWFLFFFSISILVLAGYTITFSGAIVRYRSFVMPLAITPLLCQINWNCILRRK